MFKLNNRGWGLQAMMAGVLVLMIALIITSVLIEKVFNDMTDSPSDNSNITEKPENEENKYTTYSEIEKDVVNASKKYQKKYYSDILDGEKISVTIKNLQSDKLLPEIKDIKDDNIICSGYAIFKNKDDNITYHAYIKCGSNYETIGYQEFYDM